MGEGTKRILNSIENLNLWILVLLVVVVIAFLYYPYQETWPSPNLCIMPAGMTCVKYSFSSSSDKLEITITSGYPNLTITNMSCTKDPNQFEPLNNPVVMNQGDTYSFVLSCNDDLGKPINFSKGGVFSGKINVGYFPKEKRSDLGNWGPEYYKTFSGDVYIEAD